MTYFISVLEADVQIIKKFNISETKAVLTNNADFFMNLGAKFTHLVHAVIFSSSALPK